MTGIEILATQDVVYTYASKLTVFCLILGVLFDMFMIIGIITSLLQHNCSNLPVYIATGLLVGMIVGSQLCDILFIPIEYETQYKVTISDEVSMNEFLEKYEIIDQEGKIFTIRERNQEDLQ